MLTENAKTNSDTYATILWSYLTGALRLEEAELATHRFSVSVARYKLSLGQKTDGVEIPAYLKQMERMSYGEWDAFNYVTLLSYLVYATSLLDTFLNETTKFLLLLHPGAIGKDVKLTTEELLAAKRPTDLLSIAVSRKAREVSFGSFKQRIDFLMVRFSLRLSFSPELSEQLEHYSSVRNVVVHDQGFIELYVSEVGAIGFTQRTCARHPTAVQIDDLRKVYRSYSEIVRQIGEIVLHDVLHVNDHESGENALRLLANKAGGLAEQEPR